MASIHDLLKPFRFDAECNSLMGAKQLKHWLKTFTDLLEKCEETTTAQEVRASN